MNTGIKSRFSPLLFSLLGLIFIAISFWQIKSYMIQDNYEKIEGTLVDINKVKGENKVHYQGEYSFVIDDVKRSVLDVRSYLSKRAIPDSALICINPENHNDYFVAKTISNTMTFIVIGLIAAFSFVAGIVSFIKNMMDL